MGKNEGEWGQGEEAGETADGFAPHAALGTPDRRQTNIPGPCPCQAKPQKNSRLCASGSLAALLFYVKWREIVISFLKGKPFHKRNEKQWLPTTPVG